MISQIENHKAFEENNSYMEMPPTLGSMPEGLIQIIWRSRWIVLLTTVVALAGAYVYLAKTTPLYTSTSRVYVEQSGPKIYIDPDKGVMTQSTNYLYTQAELLTSISIITNAVETLNIGQMKTFARIDNPVGYLKRSLRSIVGKKDEIINVSFDSTDPDEAAQIVNAIVDSYITYNTTHKHKTSVEVLKILQKEQDKCSEELLEKQKALANFQKENVESQQGENIRRRFESLSTALTEAQLATIESKVIYESTKEMVSNPERTSLKSRLNDLLQLRIIGPLRYLTINHPDVKALDNQIAHIKAQIDNLDAEFAQTQLAVAEQKYLAAKEKEDQIAKYFEDQRRQNIDLNYQLAQYAILQSDWEITKRRSDTLNERIKEVNVTGDVGALNICILENARPARTPSEPQKARIMGIALVVGLMLGGGLALLRDWVDKKPRSAEEISAILGAPVLGVVPSMSRRQGFSARGQTVHLDPNSSAAEAYRTIRTAVFFGVPSGEAKTILVTSPASDDGKTTLVSNLAIAMAKAAQKTLIIDADFRKPMQHNIFKLNSKDKGLSSVLVGTTTLKEAIEPTEVKGLDLLKCGPDLPNPSEMLNSRTFAKLLEFLSNKYDRIIIDSPPVMPVTDTQILAAICDITLVVLRAEKSTRKCSQQAREGLLSVSAHILGAVVNDVSKKNGRYGYYSGYSYNGHGRHKKEQPSERTPAVVMEGSRCEQPLGS